VRRGEADQDALTTARAVLDQDLPAAILGTSHLWLGPFPKPRRVGMWPAVRDEYAPVRAGDCDDDQPSTGQRRWAASRSSVRCIPVTIDS
jgi:hypothetical protein